MSQLSQLWQKTANKDGKEQFGKTIVQLQR